jgi:hypothetical protein
LSAQSEFVTKKLFAAAEKLQPVLKTGIAGATRLLSAWRDYVAASIADQLLGYIDPSRKAEALPLVSQLALLSRDYLGAREAFNIPAESWAWSQPLKPMPSQKLDTGLIADPLFKPPDPQAVIKTILAVAQELVKNWGALLTEVGKAEHFTAPAFTEPPLREEAHPEWANPLELLATAGRNPLSLGSLVFDPQGVQQLGANLSGDRQPLRLLERSNRLTAIGANFSVYRPVVITALSKFRLHCEGQISPILVVVNRSVASIGIIVGVPSVGGVPPREANREANREAERNEIKNEDEIIVMAEEEIVVEPIINELIINELIINELIINELIINELIINEPIINELMVVKETVVINETMVIKEMAVVTKPLSHKSPRPASCRNSHTVVKSASCEPSHTVMRSASSGYSHTMMRSAYCKTSHTVPRYGWRRDR